MTRPLKMPGARASKQVLRDRLAAALEQIAALEELFQRAHGVHHSWVERALRCQEAHGDPRKPEEKDHAQP